MRPAQSSGSWHSHWGYSARRRDRPRSDDLLATTKPTRHGVCGTANGQGTVEKHVRSILTRLDLPESDTEHRRVLAVLRFLDAR